MRGVWTVEPWSGALSLNLGALLALLDRYVPGHDPEIAARLTAEFEAGAVKGWSKILAQKRREK